jgi:hypothetical protein
LGSLKKFQLFDEKRKNSGAMLIILALFLCISIISAAALSSDIENINVKTISGRSRSLIYEFNILQTKFEDALNKSLNLKGITSGETAKINKTFTEVVENFSRIELNHGIFFNATLIDASTYEIDFLIFQKNTKINGTIKLDINLAS